MIVPDANLLLYAYNTSAPEHERAKSWWEEMLTVDETVGLPWQTITAFIRITTNTRAYPQPLSIAEAVEIVTSWLEQPNTLLLVPTARHWSVFSRLLVESQCTGPLTMDAHLAALALEHGATLCTHDADFARFKKLRRHDPLTD